LAVTLVEFVVYKINKLVEVTPLKEIVRASFQYSTKSGASDTIEHETGSVNVSDSDYFIINGSSASAGDGFCGLKLAHSLSTIREVHQNKHIKDNVDVALYNSEWKKGASDQDLFILYTTNSTSVTAKDLPAHGGIVSMTNYEDYFGPFAGRAFKAHRKEISINKATRSQLRAASGIGVVTAKKILDARQSGPFISQEDFKERTGLKRTFDAFEYPN